MKIKYVVPAALLMALTALGYVVELVIAIMVLAVGGIIIYKLLGLYNQVLGPNSPQQTNSVVTEFWYDRGAAVKTVSTTNFVASVNVMSLGGCQLEYGVASSNGLPWVCLGSNIPVCLNTNYADYSVVYTLENDSNYMDMVVNVGTNLTHIVDDINANTVTNWPAAVYIQSSTNLTDWNTILTDTNCSLDSVTAFTDTSAPSGSNFYRAVLQ